MSDTSQGLGWWQATDMKWYAPETHPEYQPETSTPTEGDVGAGEFGDGAARPLYEFRASRFKGGRMFSPNVIRVWPDRIEEHEQHAVLKSGTQSINFHQVAQVKLRKGLRWSDISVESTGGHTITLRGVPKADGDRVKGLIDASVHATRTASYAPAPQPNTLASTAPVPSVADELLKLAQLRDAGVLSPDEFEEQKTRALLPPS